MNLYPAQLRQRVIARLAQNSINPTRQRVEIGMCLFDCDKHITADQLLDLVNQGRHEVSKATVYNTLGLFASKGLLREVVVDPGKQIFDTNTAPHHHVYNTDTGELKDIESTDLVVSGLPVLDESIEITGVDIVVRVKNA